VKLSATSVLNMAGAEARCANATASFGPCRHALIGKRRDDQRRIEVEHP
jgi:hypothetical protein